MILNIKTLQVQSISMNDRCTAHMFHDFFKGILTMSYTPF